MQHTGISEPKHVNDHLNQNASPTKLLAQPATNQLRLLEATARTLADSLGALAALEESRATADPGSTWLDLRAIADRYGVKRDALLNAADRGELLLKRGPRRKLLVELAEIERWIASKPYLPRAPKISAPTSPSNDDWERRAADELGRIGGRA
jgi:hypothetical protein